MSNLNYVYKKIKTEEYVLVHLNGAELPQTVPEEFIEWIKELLQSPINVIVNCFIPDYIPQTWFGLFTILNTQLSDTDKRFYLIYVSSKLKENCAHTDFGSFQIRENLREAIRDLNDPNSEKPPVTLMRAFVKSIISTMFIQANTPIIRQKIYVKKKASDIATLKGEISGVVMVQTEDYFYYLSIGCSERSFIKIMSAMLLEEYTEITKDISNGLSEIVNIVLGQVKKSLSGSQKFSYTIPLVYRGTQAPQKDITFNDQRFKSFTGGETIVIPFQSNKGEIFIELWYLKVYEQYLLK